LEAVLEAITKAVIKRPEDGPPGGRHNYNDRAEATRKPRCGPGEGPSLKGPEAPMSQTGGGQELVLVRDIHLIYVLAFLVRRTIVPSAEPVTIYY
jgi:hypothetical protein